MYDMSRIRFCSEIVSHSLLRSPSLIGTVAGRSFFSTMCVKDPYVPCSTNGDEADGVCSTVPLSRDSRSHSREADL
jgi:hypothetical protein